MLVRSARNAQRDLIEVGTQPPSLIPERMYTSVYTLKNIPAISVNRDVRILTSKDGELAVNIDANQIIITDWVSNLNRIAEILKVADVKPDPSVAKMVESQKKEAKEARARWEKEQDVRRILTPLPPPPTPHKEKKNEEPKGKTTN